MRAGERGRGHVQLRDGAGLGDYRARHNAFAPGCRPDHRASAPRRSSTGFICYGSPRSSFARSSGGGSNSTCRRRRNGRSRSTCSCSPTRFSSIFGACCSSPAICGYDGYKDYFYSRRRWFFGLVLLGQLVDVADTLLKGIAHFRSLGATYPIGIAVLSALLLIAMWTRMRALSFRLCHFRSRLPGALPHVPFLHRRLGERLPH